MDISVVALEKSEVSAEAVAVAVSDLKGTAGKQHFYSIFILPFLLRELILQLLYAVWVISVRWV